MSITYSGFVFVALGIQHAMRTPRVVTCGLVRLYNIFRQYLIKGTIFEKKIFVGHKMYFSIFSTILSEIFFILRKIKRDTIKDIRRSLCKVPAVLVRF